MGLFSAVRKKEKEQIERSERESAQAQRATTSVSGEHLDLKVLHPTRFEDCLFIIDEMKEQKTLLVNCEALEYPTLCRFIDFISGGAYALKYGITKSTGASYFVAPLGVDVGGVAVEEENGGDTEDSVLSGI